MSPAHKLLEALRDRGIDLATDGGELRVRPVHAVTPEIRAQLVAHKAELIELLAHDVVAAVVRVFDGAVEPREFKATALLLPEPVPEGPGTTCRACHGAMWWRLRERATWICARCHPPLQPSSLIEVAGADEHAGNGSSRAIENEER